MSSDNSDKTVFRQPGTAAPAGEHTIIRPMPGRRGGSGNTQLPPSAATASPGYGQPGQEYAQQPARVDVQAAYFRTSTGLNPLVNAA